MVVTRRRVALAAGALAVIVALAAILLVDRTGFRGDRPAAVVPGDTVAFAQAVDAMCRSCHAPAPAEILPRAAWPHTIRGMYHIAEQRGVELPLAWDQVAAWYVERAPQRLAPAPRADAGPGAVTWQAAGWAPSGAHNQTHPLPTVGHVRAARLFGGAGDDLIVSDMVSNRVYALRPYLGGFSPVVLGEVGQPTRVAVVDLDGNGALDVVVAGVGQMLPTNEPVGSVVWLRRTGPATFEPVVLADDLGRVGDVAAADITGNGHIDVAVAVFGWQSNGGLLLLENQGGTGSVPQFTQRVLDDRPGFLDVRIVDMDGDGRLDLVTVLAQEFQEVVVYWGDERGFRPEVAYAAPHPDWGYTGLEVVDFTGNGRPDIIVTNGDGLDVTVAKPHHGVALLENVGGRRFEYRHLTHMYGAHRAQPVDLAGDGRVGLLVGAYLPAHLNFGHPDPPESVLWLERVGPTQLVRRVLQAEGPYFMTLGAGDLTGNGRTDFAAGWMDLAFADTLQAHRGEPLPYWVTIWRNGGVVGAAEEPPPDALIDWSRPAAAGPDGVRRRRRRVRQRAASGSPR
jgi:hypothetical protein